MPVGAVVGVGTVDARLHEYTGRQLALQVQQLTLEPAGLTLGGIGLTTDGQMHLELIWIHLSRRQWSAEFKLKREQAIDGVGRDNDRDRNIGLNGAVAE